MQWDWATRGHRDAFEKLKPGVRRILLNALAPAAGAARQAARQAWNPVEDA